MLRDQLREQMVQIYVHGEYMGRESRAREIIVANQLEIRARKLLRLANAYDLVPS